MYLKVPRSILVSFQADVWIITLESALHIPSAFCLLKFNINLFRDLEVHEKITLKSIFKIGYENVD
jgi:hypothetical protein